MSGLYPGNIGLAVRDGYNPTFSYVLLGSLSIGDRFSFDIRQSPREVTYSVSHFDGRYVVCIRDGGKEFRFLRSRLVLIYRPYSLPDF